jgi:hypothetical protein
MLRRPGRLTFRQWSRDRPSHETTVARWFARDVDVVRLNRAALVAVVPPSPEHVLACEPSVGPNSGTHRYGLDMFWTGAHRRAEQGVARATLAWVEVTPHRAYTRRVAQTAPAPHRDPEGPRIEASLSPLARVVTTPPLPALTYLAVDGDFSHKPCVAGLGAWDLPVIGQLRRDA